MSELQIVPGKVAHSVEGESKFVNSFSLNYMLILLYVIWILYLVLPQLFNSYDLKAFKKLKYCISWIKKFGWEWDLQQVL